LCKAIDLSQLAEDERFASNALRVENSTALERLLSPAILKFTRDELLTILETAVVPAGPINTVKDVFEDAQFIARNMLINPEGIPGVRTPIQFSDSNLNTEHCSPVLGSRKLDKTTGG